MYNSRKPRGKIVLFDPKDHGHHRSFLNLYTKVLAESDFEVLAISPFELEDLPSELKGLIGHIRIGHEIRLNDSRGFMSSIKTLRSIARTVGAVDNADIILFMDKLSWMSLLPGRLIDLLFPFPWAVLDMHPTLEEIDGGLIRPLKRKVFGGKSLSERYLSSRYLRFVAFLSETAPETYRRYYPPLVFAWLPDASNERIPRKQGRIAAEIQQAANGRKIITIAGSLEQRKGLYQMMYIATYADKTKYFFAFCGKVYWNSFYDNGRLFRQFCASRPTNCYFNLEFISDVGADNEFDSILYCSDVIFAAMQGYQHSSNVLTKAARMRKPVIASGTGICGLRAMKYRLGAVVPEGDVFCGLRAVERLTGTSRHVGAWDDYASDFSVLKLRQTLSELCRQSIGSG